MEWRAALFYFRNYYLRRRPPWDQPAAPDGPLAELGTAAGQGNRALDVGCGTARNAIWLARRGWQVDAVDCFRRPLGLAARRIMDAGVDGSVRLLRAEATALDRALAPSDEYDLMLDVLGPASDLAPRDLLAYASGLHRRRRVDGRLFIHTFVPTAVLSEPFTAAGWQLSDEVPHGVTGTWSIWR